MNKKVFHCVGIIGFGAVAKEVIKTSITYQPNYGYDIKYFAYERAGFDATLRYAQCHGIDVEVCVTKEQVESLIIECSRQGKMLIVSANNNYLFPPNIVDDSNIEIVNFHNALLPDYPGRNAASWAIFEGKRQTGITWHYVTNDIDAGDIVIQLPCEIHEDTKAYELAAELMKLASRAFDDCFPAIIESRTRRKKQTISKERRIFKSEEIPGSGEFSIYDSADYIYRLLRSVDYGNYEVFPKLITYINGNKVTVEKYKVTDTKEENLEKTIQVRLREDKYISISYSYVD